MGAGLVVDYQRQLYEYWGPEADEEEAAASDTDDGSVEEIVVDDDDDVQGEGRENGSLRRVAPPLALDVAHYARAAGLDARAAEAAREARLPLMPQYAVRSAEAPASADDE